MIRVMQNSSFWGRARASAMTVMFIPLPWYTTIVTEKQSALHKGNILFVPSQTLGLMILWWFSLASSHSTDNSRYQVWRYSQTSWIYKSSSWRFSLATFMCYFTSSSTKPPTSLLLLVSDHSGTSIEMHPWNKILQSPPLLWDATEMAASTTA